MQCCWKLSEKCFCRFEMFLPVSHEMMMSSEVRMGWYFVVMGYVVLLKAETCGIYHSYLESEIGLSGI